MKEGYVARLIDLTDSETQQIRNMSVDDARRVLRSGDASNVRSIEGSFALVARDGEQVFMARSLERPLRFFLAKEVEGPMLVVAESIAEIQACLDAESHAEQFHPSYTRMVPAHHVMTLRLVGCPDPNPSYERFVEPRPNTLPADLDEIGRRYVEALRASVDGWLASLPPKQPIGVLFSGGIDSGSVFLSVYRGLLERGESPARLKAFTLSVDGNGADLEQARDFLHALDLELFLEVVEVPAEAVDPFTAIEVIEDYKPLDVECAAVNLALLSELRARYPEWVYLADGDGGDENLKDYAIEENPELTIRSVVNNPVLYQEGWGVDCVKHSLTYSGGMSRGCVRTFAPARKLGFRGFSPFAEPALVEIAAAVPFAELARGSHRELYALKGEILRRGMAAVFGLELPVFPKRRFQQGAVASETFWSTFAEDPMVYRRFFEERHRHALV